MPRSLRLVAFALVGCQVAHLPSAPPPVESPPVASHASPDSTLVPPPAPPSAAPLADPPAAPPAVAAPSDEPRAPEAPVACGRRPGDRIERVQWAHGNGNAQCDALETLWANVPHADRACRSDDECTIISSDGNCIRLPLTKAAAKRAEYRAPPCGNPMSGACPGDRGQQPRCVSGCCVAK